MVIHSNWILHVNDWIYFSILAAFLWAVGSIIDKFVLTKLIKNPLIPVIFSGVFGLISLVLILAFVGIQEMIFQNIIIAVVSGLLEIFGIVFYFKAVKKEEISRLSGALD